MHDLAERQRQIGDDVGCGHHLLHRQLGQGRQCVGGQAERRRAGPGTFQVDILQVVLDQLANARRAVDMRDDLEQEVGRSA